MRPLLLLSLCVLGMAVLAGCESLGIRGQDVADLGRSLAPFLADSIAAATAQAINQGAAGRPIGPDELAVITDTTRAALDAGLEAHAGGASIWGSILAGLGGGAGAGITIMAPRMVKAGIKAASV